MDAISSYLSTTANNNTQATKANQVSGSLSGLSSASSKEDLEKAAKSFESYMAEQVIKEVKDTLGDNSEEEDQTMSQYTDYYMDSTIQTMAGDLVDKYAGNFTDTMVEQMARNYGIDLNSNTDKNTNA